MLRRRCVAKWQSVAKWRALLLFLLLALRLMLKETENLHENDMRTSMYGTLAVLCVLCLCVR